MRGKVDPNSTTTGTGLTTTSEVQRGAVIDVMFRSEPTHGQQVITTLDPVMQRAAEDALNADSRTSAMVIMQVSTGDILVLANGPNGTTTNNAMVGQYPPGSIFKVVSGYAIMRDRFGPEWSESTARRPSPSGAAARSATPAASPSATSTSALPSRTPAIPRSSTPPAGFDPEVLQRRCA